MNDRKTSATDPAPDDAAQGPDVQGEGNYDAARRHRQSVEQYVGQADVAQDARDAAPDSPEEAEELKQAEREGKSHARR